MKEKLNRRRKIALGTALLVAVAGTGIAAIKYSEIEANIRAQTISSTLSPDLVANSLVVAPTYEQIAAEQELVASYGFEPLPLGQIQDKKELKKETRRRINATKEFMAQSNNPLFRDTGLFLKEQGDKKTVLILPVDSLSPDYLPMDTTALIDLDQLSYGIPVSSHDATYDLNLVGMALLLTEQIEGIRHNMEHVIPFGDIVNVVDQQSRYLTDDVNMRERVVREKAILTQALLFEAALGYKGVVHRKIQEDAERFIDVYGNPLTQ